MLRSRTLASCLGVLAFGVPSLARAVEPELVALRWEGYGESEGCLGVPSLIARVEDHLGRRAFDPASEQVVSVTVDQRAGGAFRALVRVIDASGKVLGERELLTSETTCGALDDPLVLAVALLVDSDLGAEPEPEPAHAEPPAPPEPPDPPEAPAQEAREPEPPEPPEPWRLSCELTALGADGVLPELAAGAELGALLDGPWLLPVRLRAAGFLPQRAELAPQGGVDFVVALAGVAACPLSVRPDGVGVDACAGADVVMQRADSRDLDGARSETEWFFQGALSIRGLAELSGPLFATLGTSVGLPIRAPRFVYRRSGDTMSVFQMADATLTVGLGFGLRLGPR